MAHPSQAYVVSTLRLVALVASSGAVLAGAAIFWVYPDPRSRLALLGAVLALIALTYGLARGGYARLAALLFVATVWCGATAGGLLPDSGDAHTASTFLFAIVAAGLLLGERAALITAGLSLVSLVGLHFVRSSDILPNPNSIYAKPSVIWLHSAMLLTVTALVAVAVNRIRSAAEESQRNEQRFRTLVDNAPLGVLTLDPAGRIVTANAAYAELVGAPEPAVLLGLRVRSTPSWSPELGEAMHRVLGSGEQGVIETSWTSRWGKPVRVRLHGAPIRDEKGRVLGIHAIAEDLSRRERAEERAIRLGRILESARNEIYVFEADTLRFLQVNRGARENLGYSMRELHELTPLDIKPEFTSERFEALLAPLRNGSKKKLQFETVHRRKDGSTYPVEVHLQFSADSSSRVFAAIIVDTTERREAEAAQRELALQLRQAQKMEAVGLLAGGVAHDFNNLLTVISGNAELLRAGLEQQPELRAAAGEIQQAAQRASELTRQLLQFGRKETLRPKVVDLNQLVAGLESMLRRLLGPEVQLAVESDAGVGRVCVDPVQLEQVIVNLALNARDAMPGGGRLRLALGNVELETTDVVSPDGARPGSFVTLSVSDTGMGMPEEVQARVFEPFFTTKPPGEGSGLGLSTSYGIVRQSGGTIRVRSAPARGSTFEVLLPEVEDEACCSGPAERSTVTQRGRDATVLLVEDEPAVLRLLAKVLESRGHRVLAAGDGEDAFARASSHAGPIDLLISDVVMPGPSAAELDARVRRLHPGIRTILISGHPARADQPRELPEHALFLNKPFAPEELASAVETVLRSQESGAASQASAAGSSRNTS